MKELVTNQRFPMYLNTDQRVKKNLGHTVKERMMKTMTSMTVKITMMMKMIINRMSVEKQNQMVSTPPDYEITKEEENQEDDDDVMGGEQEDKEDEELYGDLNLNLDRRDAEMTDA
ncbi:hypothetical protein Tco_0857421 [Tanacetum coccineum]|uniref:Uncharacterized protein n=1 Tax=Tanacetum coccineum TaxID=301880 RepID=A0ABQ5BAF9_9ASTR